jgi:hypothetical protein
MSARNSIISFEKQIRAIIEIIMTSKYGLNWKLNPTYGLSTETIQKLEKIRQDEKNKNKEAPSHLLDYAYINDLSQIIMKNWEDFSNLFESKKRTEVLMDILLKFRNPCMHGREISDYKYHLCIGISNYFLDLMKLWKEGYKKKITKYECIFEIFIRVENEELLDKKITNWISTISSGFKSELHETERTKSYMLTSSKGKATIEIDNKMMPYSYPEGYNLANIFGKTITLSTNSKDIITDIMEKGKYPYWGLRIFLAEKLDLSVILQDLETLGKDPGVSRGWKRGEEPRISSLELTIYEIKDLPHTFQEFIECHLLADQINLFYQGRFDYTFYKAHEISLEKLFDMIYDKTSYLEKEKTMLDLLHLN